MATSAGKTRSRKRPVTYGRVWVVLVSLVFSLALCSGVLMLLEGRPISGVNRYALAARTIGINGIDFSKLLRLGEKVQAHHWKYIVIYQSDSLSGDADALARGDLMEYSHGSGRSGTRGLQEVPANFHFVIDNGRNNARKADGFVEAGTSWMRQQFSAPYCQWPVPRYHKYTVYKQAIGVCLIGDLAVRPFSGYQVASLKHLVRRLQRRYNIPDSRVKFQWGVANQATTQEASFSRQFHRLLSR